MVSGVSAMSLSCMWVLNRCAARLQVAFTIGCPPSYTCETTLEGGWGRWPATFVKTSIRARGNFRGNRKQSEANDLPPRRGGPMIARFWTKKVPLPKEIKIRGEGELAGHVWRNKDQGKSAFRGWKKDLWLPSSRQENPPPRRNQARGKKSTTKSPVVRIMRRPAEGKGSLDWWRAPWL